MCLDSSRLACCHVRSPPKRATHLNHKVLVAFPVGVKMWHDFSLLSLSFPPPPPPASSGTYLHHAVARSDGGPSPHPPSAGDLAQQLGQFALHLRLEHFVLKLLLDDP